MEKCTHRMSAERTVAQEWRTRRRTETGATFESRARKFPFPHIARERMLGLLEVQCDKNQMGFAIFYYGGEVSRLTRRLLGATEREMHRKRRRGVDDGQYDQSSLRVSLQKRHGAQRDEHERSAEHGAPIKSRRRAARLEERRAHVIRAKRETQHPEHSYPHARDVERVE